MKFFNKYIHPKLILSVMLGFAILGTGFIFISVNRINGLLNVDLGFDKHSVIALRTVESKTVFPDTLVFSSDLPGLHVNHSVDVKTEYKRRKVNIAHQFVSDNYFDFFKYEKIVENPELFLKHGNAQLIYVNKSAIDALGIKHIDDAIGTILTTNNNHELIICGVLKDYHNLCIHPEIQPKIYQINSEHLAYAFVDKSAFILSEEYRKNNKSAITFQDRIQKRYRIIEDAIYSVFFFINIIILLTGIGYIGNKYTNKKEKELYHVLGIGIHVLTIIVSKTYLYLIAIIGFVVGPLAFVIQKIWLEIYQYRIHFGLTDLFIILSMFFLTAYMVWCPMKIAKKLEENTVFLNPK